MPAIHLVNFLSTVQMPGPLPSDLKSLPSRVQDMYQQLTDFMSEYVYPNEAELSRHQASEDCWTPHPLVEEIKVEVSSFKYHTWVLKGTDDVVRGENGIDLFLVIMKTKR